MTTPYSSNFYGTEPFSDTAVQFNLVTDAGQSYTVPGLSSQKYKARFSYNSVSNVFVGYNVTPSFITSGVNTTQSNVELRPDIRYVKGQDELGFLTSDAAGAYVSVSLLAIPG